MLGLYSTNIPFEMIGLYSTSIPFEMFGYIPSTPPLRCLVYTPPTSPLRCLVCTLSMSQSRTQTTVGVGTAHNSLPELKPRGVRREIELSARSIALRQPCLLRSSASLSSRPRHMLYDHHYVSDNLRVKHFVFSRAGGIVQYHLVNTTSDYVYSIVIVIVVQELRWEMSNQMAPFGSGEERVMTFSLHSPACPVPLQFPGWVIVLGFISPSSRSFLLALDVTYEYNECSVNYCNEKEKEGNCYILPLLLLFPRLIKDSSGADKGIYNQLITRA
ncbi:hypothetical protein J6590_005913 [Homalodisca vitripennis]|nr:hypothetical protein J6590_005913 [Homalodisca vitripennis]